MMTLAAVAQLVLLLLAAAPVTGLIRTLKARQQVRRVAPILLLLFGVRP